MCVQITVETIIPEGFKRCECDCGELIPEKDKWGRKRRFKPSHRNRGSKHQKKLEQHWKWNGGKRIRNGYIQVLKRNHPRSDSDGYIMEHRLIFEEYNRCCLLPWIDIHHIDGNKSNNKINNLKPLSSSEHTKIHFKKDMSNRVCLLCKSKTTIINKKTGYYSWYKYHNGFICRKCYNKT